MSVGSDWDLSRIKESIDSIAESLKTLVELEKKRQERDEGINTEIVDTFSSIDENVRRIRRHQEGLSND